MKFSAAFVIAALPFLVAGVAIEREAESITIPLAKRTSGIKDRVQFHLAQRDALKAKLQRGFEAYKKNTGEDHPLAAKATFTKRATGNDALTDDAQELWYGPISVGTPAVQYTVDFDTGSSDLFLPASTCGSTCSGHTKYTPSASSTSVALGKSFSLSYGDGSTVSGKQYTDTVTIAGLTATKQTLGSATTYSSGFQSANFPADGLLGMGFQSISDYNASPVFQTLVSEGKTTSSVFAFKLSSSGPQLTLGGVNSALYTGAFSYASVTSQGYWEVNIGSVKAGTTTLASSVDSIIDTGTTLIIGDSATVKKIYAKIPGSATATDTVGAGYYTVPCTGNPSTISLTFGGKAFTIDGSTLALDEISTGKCLGGFAADDSVGFWIVGDVFLQNAYTVFDYGNSRVGFATLA